MTWKIFCILIFLASSIAFAEEKTSVSPEDRWEIIHLKEAMETAMKTIRDSRRRLEQLQQKYTRKLRPQAEELMQAVASEQCGVGWNADYTEFRMVCK